MLVTSGEDATGSPRCCSQAYLKSAAEMGTPSDHTALGFKVYTTVWGLMLTTSEDSTSCELKAGVPSAPTTNGLGRTAPSTVRAPGLFPSIVLGLHPDTLWVMPNEIDPPATPT